MSTLTNKSESENLKAQIEALKAQQKELRKRISDGRHQLGNDLSVQVSETTGTVSVYGFGRFPVSLYRDQWEMLFPAVAALVKFINDNGEEIAKIEAKAAAEKSVAKK